MTSKDKKNTMYNSLITRILKGEGKASAEERYAAFSNSGLNEPMKALINKVALHPVKILDEDIKEAITSGFTEDQIFELIICGAVGQAARQYESALDALAKATNKEDTEDDTA